MATLNLDILTRQKTVDKEDEVIYRDLHLDIKQKFPLRNELEKEYQSDHMNRKGGQGSTSRMNEDLKLRAGHR